MYRVAYPSPFLCFDFLLQGCADVHRHGKNNEWGYPISFVISIHDGLLWEKVVLFALAWLPYHAYFIYVYHDFRITSYRYIQHIYLAFYWLAMSNAMVTLAHIFPLLYIMSIHHRQHPLCALFVYRSIRSSTTFSMTGRVRKERSQRISHPFHRLFLLFQIPELLPEIDLLLHRVDDE